LAVARAARPAEPRVISAFCRAGCPSLVGSEIKSGEKAEMTLGSAGLAARATSKTIFCIKQKYSYKFYYIYFCLSKSRRKTR
jgi:hypothetical protein